MGEAEQLLRSSFQALADHPSIPKQYRRQRLNEAAKRLVNFYESQDNRDQVQSWKRKIAEIERGAWD